MKISALLRLCVAGVALVAGTSAARADDGERLLTVDHYVMTKSIVPVIKGQPAQIYVRERAKAGNRRSMHARARPGPAEKDRAPLRHSHPAPSRVASASASGGSDGGGSGGAGGGGDPRLLLAGPLFGTPLPLPPTLVLARARGGDVLASDDS